MDKENTDQSLLRTFTKQNSTSLFSSKVIMIFILVVLLGVATGYLLAQNQAALRGIEVGSTNNSNETSITKGTIVGSDDLKTFKDSTEGVIKEGGFEDEGQFHLVRPGGESQNVYLTSSTVDLSKFLNRKVKIWGETQKAQKVGWLMDVGRVEVLE